MTNRQGGSRRPVAPRPKPDRSERTRAAVLGSPIAHSLSPVLHRAAYQQLGLEGWTYEAFEVEEGGLAAFLKQLDGTWAGLSLTMPLKQEALKLVRMRSATATEAAGANTLLPVGKGWSAENTDVPGLLAALAEAKVDVPERVAVLGSGATAWSAVVALVRGGAKHVTVSARNGVAAQQLVARLDAGVVRSSVVRWGDPGALRVPLVVSTVPKGAADVFAPLVPNGPATLFDVVYDPWPTPLAAAWEARGGRVLGGLDLLVHQAVLQVELMSGKRPSVRTLRRAGLAALAAR